MKLNNKGFAISTILYGLLIIIVLTTSVILGTMAFTRKNSKEFVDDVRKELEDSSLVGGNIEISEFNLESEYFRQTGQSVSFIMPSSDRAALEINGTIKVCFRENFYANTNTPLVLSVKNSGDEEKLKLFLFLSAKENDEQDSNCFNFSGKIKDENNNEFITAANFNSFGNDSLMKIEIEIPNKYFYDYTGNYNELQTLKKSYHVYTGAYGSSY